MWFPFINDGLFGFGVGDGVLNGLGGTHCPLNDWRNGVVHTQRPNNFGIKKSQYELLSHNLQCVSP